MFIVRPVCVHVLRPEAKVQTNMAAVLHGFGRPVDSVNKLKGYKRHPNKITNDDAAFCFGVDRKADGCGDTCVYVNRSCSHQLCHG